MNSEGTFNDPGLSKVWCVIPVYNNASTAMNVIGRCRRQLGNVLVVDDGSSDIDLKAELDGSDIQLIRHSSNKGKGAALVSAMEFLHSRNASHMITLDADGQHSPEDIPSFLPIIAGNERMMVIGCRDFSAPNFPASSKFGCRLSNLCVRLETGLDIHDSQCGFRAYPVKPLHGMRFNCLRYNFETEVLVRAAWAGVEFKCVTVSTFYPEPHLRISHFRPIEDNLRISLTHLRLIATRLLHATCRGKLLSANRRIGETANRR